MGNENDIRIVLGSKRFAGNTDKDVSLQVPLSGVRRTMVEGDRSIVVDAEERFNIERQGSTFFRVSGKISNILNNTISGKTTLGLAELMVTLIMLLKVLIHIIGLFMLLILLVAQPPKQCLILMRIFQ